MRQLAFLFFLLGTFNLFAQEKKQTFANGKLVAEYTWYNGKPKGPYTQWYPNGKLQSKGVIDGNTRSGTSWWYFENDTIRKTVEFKSSFLRAGDFHDYVLEESVTEFWENGRKKFLKKFKNGEELYGTINWYANGQLKSTEVVSADGSHHIFSEYFETGQKKSERPFLAEKKENRSVQDGTYRQWNEVGTLLFESNTKDGKQNGAFREWNAEGKPVSESYYENGIVIAQKKWDGTGKLVVDFDKRKENNEIEAIYYHPDKTTVRELHYIKKYAIDDSIITLHYSEQYSPDGKLTSFYIKYNQGSALYFDQLAFWSHNQFTLPFITTNSRAGKFKVTGYSGMMFKARYTDVGGFRIDPMFNPTYPGTVSNTQVSLELPAGFTPAKMEKAISDKVKALKASATDSTKIRVEYMITPAQAEKIAPFYRELIPKVYFDSAVVSTAFDSTLTGPFTITFTGTKMKCTGSLKNGLLDGKYIFWLDDENKLNEIDYRFGLQHGETKEWYVNGKPARTAIYRYNERYGPETFYYFNGGKKNEEEYAGGKNPVKKTSWYENGTMKSSITFYSVPKSQYNELKDEWYENGAPKKISLFTDSIYKEATLDRNGKITGIHVNDYKNNYFISKEYARDRLYRKVDIKDRSVKRYEYAFEKNGVKISGVVTWDSVAGAWNMEDNMGTLVVVDRSVLKFREDLPCGCSDYTKSDFFAQPTKDFISEENFKKYQLDFHQPLTGLRTIFGDPNYNFGNYHTPPESFPIGKEYSYYSKFWVMGDLTMALPDSNGLLFSLTPCRSKNAFASFDASISFKAGFPKQTEVSISQLQTLSLEFNADFLRQVDDKHVPLKNTQGAYLPALYLFDGDKLLYNAREELNVVNPIPQCARTAEFSGTGIFIDFNSFYPDLSGTKNYPQMDAAYNKATTRYPARATLGLTAEKAATFRGIYSDNAIVTVPVLVKGTGTPVDFTGVNILLGSNFASGTLRLAVKAAAGEKYTFTNDDNATATFTKAELEQSLIKCGWTKHIIFYDPETSELLVHFYYEK